ncbi:serine/threonine protein kinase [Sphaerisporangium album]|uniref:Serine/threonine protein kinase n=1 Tax=Sphaerisporangium album TaxID=509200 RepID=A0A367FAT0_9ACTN|nr:serine/threonine-protein kinase [Sphaerisporangium album]RCG27371.1 serine/threonine protein kinase [Sphaerisporangium album]
MPDAQPLEPDDPAHLGAYRVIGRIGEGGQAVVYLAETDAADGGLVAVKLFHARLGRDPAFRDGFARELEVAKRVARFCTAQVLDSGMENGRPYIVSEYVDGLSLHRVVREQGPRRGSALERLAISTATALVALHDAGIVHRDFKPHNVLIGPDGPRVIDFGIARATTGVGTMTSTVVGTPAYMAPEQLDATPHGFALDVFAWASTMAFAATGRPPFGNDAIPAVINRVLHAPPDLEGIDAPFRNLLTECLAKAPSRRPTARALLDRLVRGTNHAPPPTAPPQAAVPPQTPPNPRPAPPQSPSGPGLGMPGPGMAPPQGPLGPGVAPPQGPLGAGVAPPPGPLGSGAAPPPGSSSPVAVSSHETAGRPGEGAPGSGETGPMADAAPAPPEDPERRRLRRGLLAAGVGVVVAVVTVVGFMLMPSSRVSALRPAAHGSPVGTALLPSDGTGQFSVPPQVPVDPTETGPTETDPTDTTPADRTGAPEPTPTRTTSPSARPPVTRPTVTRPAVKKSSTAKPTRGPSAKPTPTRTATADPRPPTVKPSTPPPAPTERPTPKTVELGPGHFTEYCVSLGWEWVEYRETPKPGAYCVKRKNDQTMYLTPAQRDAGCQWRYKDPKAFHRFKGKSNYCYVTR